MQRATITIDVADGVPQNEIKNWIKSCPVSFEGGQTISWENIANPEQPAVDASAADQATESATTDNGAGSEDSKAA